MSGSSYGISSAVQQIGVNPFVHRAYPGGSAPHWCYAARQPIAQMQGREALLPREQQPPHSAMHSAASTSPGAVAAADPADMRGGGTEGDAFDSIEESLGVAETESSQSISKRRKKLKRRQLQQKKARMASAAKR